MRRTTRRAGSMPRDSASNSRTGGSAPGPRSNSAPAPEVLMRPTAILLLLLLGAGPALAQDVDWPNVGNDKGGMRHSPLDQIDPRNVARLAVAWTYRTGDAGPGSSTTIECTPIVVEGRMFVTTARTKVVALDPATGEEIWRFDPYGPGLPSNPIRASGGVNRGVAYW